MNNNFYILPNEEGYLVKSHDTNSEIALFRSHRDAEVFISTLTLSLTPSFSNNYSQGTSIPQYSFQPKQIITPYPTNGTSQQFFFIQQPIPIQQVSPSPSSSSPYLFYSMMPQTSQIKGICHDMYPNYYGSQNNNSELRGCTCGYNNSDYNEYFEKNTHIKNNEELKPSWNNAINDLNIKKNNQLKDNSITWTQKNDEYSNNGYEEQLVQPPIEEYNFKTVINKEQNNQVSIDKILEKQYNNILTTKPETVITPNFYSELEQQVNYSYPTNNQPYYEQAFISNSVFFNQQSEKSEQPKQMERSINIADNEFINFTNKQKINNNSKISKKETKHLMKKELKAAKIQTKLKKQNHNKKENHKKVINSD